MERAQGAYTERALTEATDRGVAYIHVRTRTYVDDTVGVVGGDGTCRVRTYVRMDSNDELRSTVLICLCMHPRRLHRARLTNVPCV